ncbi:MAG TPA: glycosyltransferase [Acidimicrobiales bacterium]
MSRSSGPGVVIDLQAAQSPQYRDRGIARYALEFTEAVAQAHPGLVRQVLLNPRLPPVELPNGLIGSVPVGHNPEWPAGGGVFHVLSAFELDVPLSELWPREVSRRGMRLVVTLYDLIPEIFSDTYLRDPGVRRRYRARREFVRAADHVVTLSDSAAADAVRLLGLSESQVSVVGAAPSGDFRPAEDRLKAAAAAQALVPELAGPYIVFNGAVEPRKNMEKLVEAYAATPEPVREGWQLVLVCRLKPSERNHFEVRAAQLGIADRLVLTGFVPDTTLKVLYQAADLAVYPSLYEGYGLPVAEALACGAPVIASETSSLPELVAPGATFDPTDATAIAQAITRALVDRARRDELLAWAERPTPTWSDVADKCAKVYEGLLRDTGVPQHRWRPRPRIAMVTPWPPARTGVADYSQRLAEAMEPYADIEVAVDGDLAETTIQATEPVRESPSLSFHSNSQLKHRDLAVGGYDAVLLAIGNSEYHGGALKLLRRGGLHAHVLTHDVRLDGLYVHGVSRGAVPEGLEAAVLGVYHSVSPDLTFDGNLFEAMSRADVSMVRDVARLADSLIVNSEFAFELARADAGPEWSDRVRLCPFAYPRPVERNPGSVDRDLVCSFGVVHPVKRPSALVEALPLLARRRPNARLALVGPVSEQLKDEIEALAEQLEVRSRLTITGEVTDADYESWLRCAAAAVQLREYSNGESSAAVADCVAHGLPTLVSRIGPQSELPAFIPKVAPDAPPEVLALALDKLLDLSGDNDLVAKSHAFAGENGFGRAAGCIWTQVPELNLWPAPA